MGIIKQEYRHFYAGVQAFQSLMRYGMVYGRFTELSAVMRQHHKRVLLTANQAKSLIFQENARILSQR